MEEAPWYYISAGEPSGDLLAGELVAALRETLPGYRPFGVVGASMRRAGVEELAGIEDLSVMGFVDVLRHLAPIRMLEGVLLTDIARRRPAFAVLVDYPGFHLRVADYLRLLGIPVFQYVAPQLWAWGEGRTARLKKVTDRVLGIMPFEEEFFASRGVNYTYVGTPQVDRARQTKGERADFGLDAGETVVGFFPGSRRGEISRILPPMLGCLPALRRQLPHVRVMVSAAPFVAPELFRDLLGLPDTPVFDGNGLCSLPQGITLVRGNSLALMGVCDAALVTSGTATLECALSGTPMAVMYVAGALTWAIAKRVVDVPHISLVNLVAGRGIVNEYVQEFSGDEVGQDLAGLASDPERIRAMEGDLADLYGRLQGDPAGHAARVIRDHLAGATA